MLENLPDHIVWLYEKYRVELTQALGREKLEISAEQAVLTMFQADPSQKKGAVDWLVKTYLEDGYLWEDIEQGALSKVNHTLTLFGSNRHRLQGNFKNLAQYSNLADVYRAIKDFAVVQKELVSVSVRAQKREIRSQVLEETKVLYRDERVIISVPLTKKSAVWWGRGTQWCTAATKNNMFNRYDHEPLIILTFPHGLKSPTPSIMSSARKLLWWKKGLGEKDSSEVRKLQLWVSEGNFQFMDETDGPVDKRLISLNWLLLEPVLKWAQSINPFVLSVIPDYVKTPEMCWKALEKADDISIRDIESQVTNHVPSRLKNNDFYYKMVSCKGYFLYAVPYFKRNKVLCLAAIQKNGEALEFVPKIHLNYDICSKAVQQSGWALKYVPEKFRDEKIYLEAIKQKRNSIQLIPENLKTPEFFFKAIALNFNVIRDVPRDIASYEMYRLAVSGGYNLRDIPQPMKLKEICRIAVHQNSENFKFVPKNLRDREICSIAVAGDAMNLKFVLKDLKTFDLCKQAVGLDGLALEHVPEKLKTYDMCKAAVSKTGYSLRYVPPDLVDEEICRIAVENSHHALECVPKQFASDSLLKLALDQSELERESTQNKDDHSTENNTQINTVQGIPVVWNGLTVERLKEEIAMSNAYSQLPPENAQRVKARGSI